MANINVTTIDENNIQVTVTPQPANIISIDQGQFGPSGFSGISGYSGYSGYSGQSGQSGFSGISGYSGSGISGWSGFSGESGFSGTSGFSGYSGFSGISGYSGVSGYSGFSGYSGQQGTSINIIGSVPTPLDLPLTGNLNDAYIVDSDGDLYVWNGTLWSNVGQIVGPSGQSGISGYSGAIGQSGISGYSGFSGISGYSGSGVSGWSGFSGTSGYSGYSGYSGLGYYGLTATGSNSLSIGSKSFTTNLDASTTAFTVGQYIRVFSTSVPSQFMEGLITAFTGTSLTVNMTYVNGVASFSNWTITNSGAVGTSGYSGYSGAVGTSGFSGSNGTNGASGISGYSGYSGFGISGWSGFSGFSGISGYSGFSGISGYSGATPAIGGSNTQVQYNNGGVLGGAANLLYSSSGNTLLAQSTDQGTGVLQVTGQSTFNGTVVDKSLNLQGGNNLLLQSQTFSNASWSTHVAGTATANVTTAPDGTSTGNSLSEGTTTNYHDVYQNITPTGTYTLTCYGKNNTGTYLNISLGSSISAAAAIFNLSTGVVSNTVSNGYTLISSSINSVGNGWYRCSITATTNAACTAFVAMSNTTTLPTTFGINNYTGTSNSIYIWGAQLELGTVASAYTPTTTAAVTTTNNISVPSGQVLGAYGTASLPTYSFGGTPSTGLSGTATSLALNLLGTNVFNVSQGGGINYLTMQGNTGSSNLGLNNLGLVFGASGTYDAAIWRDSANTLAQRNSTNAQTFRLYNTYTSSTSFENLQLDWTSTSNVATIGTQVGSGGGTARPLAFSTNATERMRIFTSGGVSIGNTTDSGAGNLRVNGTVKTGGYTVATLPTGVVGTSAYVTDALAPAYGVAVAGGGAVTIPVFYNGTNWICA